MLKFLLFILLIIVVVLLLGFSLVGKVISFFFGGAGKKDNKKSRNFKNSARADNNVLYEKEGMKVFKGSAGKQEETK